MMKNTGKPFLARFPGIFGTVIFALVFVLFFDSSPVFSQSSAPVRFQSFDLGELRGRVSHEAFVPLSGKPVTGATHTAVATLTGAFQTAQFRMVSLTGNVIRPLTLPAPSSGGTLSGFGEFSGSLVIPNQPFQVAVQGVDAQNASYDIIHPKIFTPQTIEVNFDRSQVNKSGNTSTLYADVTNHGSSDTFVIEVSEEHVEYSTGRPIGGLPSFISRVAPATLTLNTGQTGGVEVDITPPSGVPLDSGVKVRLVATNNDDVLFPAVTDTVPPTVTPPSDITVSATGGLTVVAIGLATASDNVGVYSLTSNSDGLFPVGTTVVTWVALDAAGNMGTATQNITVNQSGPDTTPPNITPPPPVTVAATGSQTAVSIGTAAATDNVSTPANILITNNAPSTFPVGGTTVTWTATDEAGNFANATQSITVNQNQPGSDTIPPNITPPPPVTVVATGSQTAVSIGTATATDNVSTPANILITNNAPSTFPVGGTTVTWTARDEAGNFANAFQTITIQSSSPPPAGGSFVPADLAGLEVWYDAGAGVTLNGSGVAGWADQSGNGHDSVQATVANQPAFSATAFNGKPSMSFDGLGDYLQAPDSAGFDKISTEMTVFMAGKVLPSSRVREILNTSFTNKTWRWRVMPDEKLQLLVNNGNLEYPQGATPVAENQYSIFTTRFVGGGDTDFYQSGSSLTGTQNTTSAINKNADHLNIGRGYVSISEYWKGEMGEIIIYARALSASETDQVGNYLAGKYGLNWTNQSNLTVTPPQNVTAEATGPLTVTGIGQATATDGANNPATISITNDAPGSFPVGSTTVTWTATNAQGNSVSGTQLVTVVDTTPPVVIAPPDVAVNSTGTLTPVDIGVATTSDVVGVVFLSNDAVVTTPPPSFPVGTTTVTWTAKDAAGNTGTATQIVTVQSASPPPGGGFFVPADLAGLEVWYDAGAGVTLNGNGVTGWADQSGNGHNSVQATSANQPVFNATAFNGKPSLSFDGLGDYLQAPDNEGLDNFSTEMTVFMAGKVLPSSRVREILNTSFTNKTWRWRVMPDEKLQLLVNDGGLEYPQGATPVTEDQYSIFTTRFVGGGETDFYQSGSTLTGTQNTTSAINTNSDHLNIGRGYVSINEYWKGEMGEIIIYSRALSASETDQVGNYLAGKYGLNWTNLAP
jgi:concanavalin A-like lectin/glucanase superfamily protein/HYR domain-containing protein